MQGETYEVVASEQIGDIRDAGDWVCQADARERVDLASLPPMLSWERHSLVALHGPERELVKMWRLLKVRLQEKYEIVGVRYLDPFDEYVLGKASSIPPFLKGSVLCCKIEYCLELWVVAKGCCSSCVEELK